MSMKTATEAAKQSKRLALGVRLGYWAWFSVLLGLAIVLADMVQTLPLPVVSSGYLLAVGGAILVSVAAVLRAPQTPSFLRDAGDPWED